MEAVLYDVPAICFSAHRAKNGMGEVTKKYLKEILSELLERPLPAGQIYNVNFPSCPISAFKGILYDRVPAQIPGYHDTYHSKRNEDGSVSVTIDPVPMESAPDGTDIGAVLTGHISIGIVQNMVKDETGCMKPLGRSGIDKRKAVNYAESIMKGGIFYG